jgi:GT2 family glycosyltransferase
MPEFTAPMPHVSIVIIAHNRLDMTKDCLNSIKSSTDDYELIFVDNASDDGTVEWVEKYCPNAKLIKNDKNLGVPKARNQGIRESTGNYIVMMDNDCVVSRGWLGDLFSPMKSGASITGIEAWVLNSDKMPIRKCVSQGEQFGYLGGACCLYKRSVFEDVGLLDEGFSPAYFEDVDISLRAKRMGLKLAWIPTPKVKHREHATLVYSQKTFSYQGALGKSAERHKGKVDGSIEFTPEFLPRRDRKLRIFYSAMYYDYGVHERGTSFEQDNFYPSFEKWDHTGEMMHFDFVELGKKHGIARMSDMLVDAVHDFAPDALFIIPFDNNHDPRMAALRRITEHTACKTIAWFCDSHWRYDNFDSHWAPNLDFCVTTAETAYAKYIRDGFGPKVIKSQWFASPNYRKIPDTPKNVDVSFIGQPHGDRRQIISWLQQNGIQVQTYGNGWGNRLSFSGMIDMFNRSKINLNLNNASDARFKQIKGRNFEVPACGGFLLTGAPENLKDYYVPEKEVVTYNTPAELVQKIKHFLANDGERQAIADAGHMRTVNEHTYKHRFDAIFSRAGLL